MHYRIEFNIYVPDLRNREQVERYMRRLENAHLSDKSLGCVAVSIGARGDDGVTFKVTGLEKNVKGAARIAFANNGSGIKYEFK